MSVIELNESNFTAEVINSDKPVLIDLWAAWCGPCRAIGPIVEEVAEDFAGKVKVAKLNVDENPAIAAKYSVMSIPTLLFFKDGSIQEQIVGLVAKEKIVKKLNNLL
jgi:thioredoxin 1